MSQVARQPMHPGAKIRNDVLPELGISETELARRLGVSVTALKSLLSERTALNVEMAVKVSRISGIGVDFWLRMQATYDLRTNQSTNWPDVRETFPRRGAA